MLLFTTVAVVALALREADGVRPYEQRWRSEGGELMQPESLGEDDRTDQQAAAERRHADGAGETDVLQ